MKIKDLNKKIKEAGPAPGYTPFTTHTTFDKKSMDLIDGALRITAFAKTAEERRDALNKYAEEKGVSVTDLLNAIKSDTGSDYFTKDDYTKDVTFSESKKMINSITESFKKIR